ncbi:HutD family protein [Myroides sp. LoEW2-1]|uniref:HutD family protein n=1 Tax=Myroides sp. LoEW2-1 TaxID=2683192 RepID=UPI001320681B|nr:HutD family protein [Myroides sp. LoEW2-1]MVX36780.1 HutD-family protein [Myroides sp. LoEW2-1]
MNRITIIKRGELQTSNWSGGKTTEYFIYPKGANYASRSFTFRISSALIEEVPSVFTNFKGFRRYLVMLDNTLDVLHQEKRKKFAKGEIFQFDSSDRVVSYSKGNDFNLMIGAGVQEEVIVHCGEIESTSSFIFIFSIELSVLEIGDKVYHLEKNDLLLIENYDMVKVNVKCFSTCVICFIE